MQEKYSLEKNKSKINRGDYTVARRYEFYFERQNNILRTSAASE